jgi:ferric-dicitrate binding protein FerR (iron transport regulator)
MADRDAQAEARAWFEKLGEPRITTAEVRAFRDWRDDPDNDAAYSALELGLERTPRFRVRPMVERYKIVDSWTGETVSVAQRPQVELCERDARRTAAHLNRRAR